MIVHRLHIICDDENCAAGNSWNLKGPAVAIFQWPLNGGVLEQALRERGWQVINPKQGPRIVKCPACNTSRKKRR